jgi:hypothetical protein
MRTSDLIDMLATGHEPVDTGRLARLVAVAAIAALVVAAAMAMAVLGPRADLGTVFLSAPVLGKFALGTALASGGCWVFLKSLRPAAASAALLWIAVLPLGVALAAAVPPLLDAAPGTRAAMVFGRNWLACLVFVPLFALLPLAALVAVARQGAPVDLRLTGLAAGLASAGLATVAYSLHCNDDAAAFIAVWYGLAVCAVAVAGALALPRLARW